MPDFNDRYDDRYWKGICAIAHRSTNGICCYCLVAQSSEVHHVRYQDQHGAIAGRELVGVDVFPVCEDCHDTLHTSKHWTKDRIDPVLGNHQSEGAIAALSLGYQFLTIVQQKSHA